MISPPLIISQSAGIHEAISLISNGKSDSIYITSNGKKITGFITSNDLTAAFSSTPRLLTEEINNADSTDALRSVYLKSRNFAISMILGHTDPYAVSRLISSVADAICQRVLTLAIKGTGGAAMPIRIHQDGRRRQEGTDTHRPIRIMQSFSKIPWEKNMMKLLTIFYHWGKK